MCSLHPGEECSLQRAVRTLRFEEDLSGKVLSLEEAYWKRVAIFKRYLKGRVNMLSAKGVLLEQKRTNRKSVTRNYSDGNFSLLNSKAAGRRGALLVFCLFFMGT